MRYRYLRSFDSFQLILLLSFWLSSLCSSLMASIVRIVTSSTQIIPSSPPTRSSTSTISGSSSIVSNAVVQSLSSTISPSSTTGQRHTRCSESYCQRTRNGKQECRFGYPKDLQVQTTININEEEPVILTARNDGCSTASIPFS